MANKKSKRLDDLVFICLEEALSLWQASDQMRVSMGSLWMLSSPKHWTGDEIPLQDFAQQLDALATKYLFLPRDREPAPSDLMITGGEAFGMVNYAIEKALTCSHSLKETQEVTPLIKELEYLLNSRWGYSEHDHPTPERVAGRYRYSAVMAAQRLQRKRVDLVLSERQSMKMIKTARQLISAYSDLMPEFAALMAERHAGHLGSSFGERLSCFEKNFPSLGAVT